MFICFKIKFSGRGFSYTCFMEKPYFATDLHFPPRRRRNNAKSITLVDWSAHFSGLGYPFSRRQPNVMWRWRARRPHTHGVLRNPIKVQSRHPFLGCRDSFWWALSFLGCRFRVFSSPRLGDPAPLVEELAHDDDVVAYDALPHPYPVHLDVRSKVPPSPDGVDVDSPIA